MATKSDVFVLTGADDLVPVLNDDGSRKTLTRSSTAPVTRSTFYRPRIEGLFAAHRALDATPPPETPTGGRSHGTTSPPCTGPTRPAGSRTRPTLRASSPGTSAQSWDDKGNAASYTYTAEDSAGVNTTAACEANRTTATRAAQVYLTAIRYGNVQPYFPDFTADQPTAFPADWMFLVVLDYGDHASTPPAPAADRPWPVRPDPFSSYRPGFEIRYLPARPAVPVLQQLPRRAHGRRELPGPVARLGLLRPAGADRPAQPELHVPGLGHRDRLRADGGLTVASMPPLSSTTASR